MSTKKLLSYVVPLVLKEGKTRLGQHYEVNFENGVKVLNSANTNYSFGSLHQIMLKGIEEVLRKKKSAQCVNVRTRCRLCFICS